MAKKITLLGSTGSIGTQSLDVIRAQGYEVFGLSAHSQTDKILQQIEEFHPKYVCMTSEAGAEKLSAALAGRADAPRLLTGPEGLKALAAMDGPDVVLNSVVGIAGLGASLAAIESGLLRECSVGVSVRRAVCSICSTERGQDCGHKPGEVYDGARCFFQLEEAVDAYEFSFVAVPAQPGAGVVKGLCPAGEPAQTLRELAAGRDLCIRELDGLEREAALGRKWLFTLREEVVRMGALADSGLDRTVLKQITDKLDAEELQALKRAYQARARERYPLPVQLEYAQKPGEEPREDGAFLI